MAVWASSLQPHTRGVRCCAQRCKRQLPHSQRALHGSCMATAACGCNAGMHWTVWSCRAHASTWQSIGLVSAPVREVDEGKAAILPSVPIVSHIYPGNVAERREELLQAPAGSAAAAEVFAELHGSRHADISALCQALPVGGQLSWTLAFHTCCWAIAAPSSSWSPPLWLVVPQFGLYAPPSAARSPQSYAAGAAAPSLPCPQPLPALPQPGPAEHSRTSVSARGQQDLPLRPPRCARHDSRP